MPLYINNAIYQIPKKLCIFVDSSETYATIKVQDFINATGIYMFEDYANEHRLNLDRDEIIFIINDYPQCIKYLEQK